MDPVADQSIRRRLVADEVIQETRQLLSSEPLSGLLIRTEGRPADDGRGSYPDCCVVAQVTTGVRSGLDHLDEGTVMINLFDVHDDDLQRYEEIWYGAGRAFGLSLVQREHAGHKHCWLPASYSLNNRPSYVIAVGVLALATARLVSLECRRGGNVISMGDVDEQIDDLLERTQSSSWLEDVEEDINNSTDEGAVHLLMNPAWVDATARLLLVGHWPHITALVGLWCSGEPLDVQRGANVFALESSARFETLTPGE